MILKTIGKQNVTPPVPFFSGQLIQIKPKNFSSLKNKKYNKPVILLIRRGVFSIPQILNLLPSGIEGVIFEQGSPFYHPAIYLAAEGIPCAIQPKRDLSSLIGKQVFVDMSNGQIMTGRDIPKHKKFDADAFYAGIRAEDYSTDQRVNVCLRSQKELSHIERLKEKGVSSPYIVLFLEPLFYELGKDPYALAKNGDADELKALMKEYVTRALSIATEGVYLRTPEISSSERGVLEKGAEGVAELRGIPYDLHRNTAFLPVMFDMVREVASQPAYRGKLHIILAMPRSGEDIRQGREILESRMKCSGITIGQDMNFTAFAETPYWLLPSSALSADVRALCKEPSKEEYLADKNGKILWGSGDLNCCFMASSRDVSEMSAYLKIKAEEIHAMRESVRAWNKIGFVPDLCGSLFWAPFPTEEQNVKFYRLMQSGRQEYTVTAQRFLDVKRIIHRVEQQK